MAIRTMKVINCDRCTLSIAEDSVYVNALVYGVVFCEVCWAKQGDIWARLLGLDDIIWENGPRTGQQAMTPYKKEGISYGETQDL